jgi:hypothetical protein
VIDLRQEHFWILDLSWTRKFFDPIVLGKGQTLETLKDAAEFIIALPSSQSRLPEWQAAMHALMLSAERGQDGADPVFARIGMLRALRKDEPLRPFSTSTKKTHWAKPKLKRDR